QTQHSSRTFTVLSRVAAAFHIDRAQCVHIHAHGEFTAGDRVDIESVELIESLAGVGAVQVDPAKRILKYAGKHGESVADIARHRIGEVNDFTAGKPFARSGLRRNDGGWRVDPVHALNEILLVNQG